MVGRTVVRVVVGAVTVAALTAIGVLRAFHTVPQPGGSVWSAFAVVALLGTVGIGGFWLLERLPP
jgi:hypothetical protein